MSRPRTSRTRKRGVETLDTRSVSRLLAEARHPGRQRTVAPDLHAVRVPGVRLTRYTDSPYVVGQRQRGTII